MTAIASWLEERLSGVPPALAGAVRALCEDAGSTGSPQGMAEAALGAFDRVASDAAGRAGALDLLAADALLTYAFEAAADPDVGGSASLAVGLAARMGPHGEIGARLARSTAERPEAGA